MDRLKALNFINNYEVMFEELEPNVSSTLSTYKLILNNPRMTKFLTYTLAVGNYLNGTSNKGGAWAFKLEALAKTADYKYNDGKHTL